MQPVTRAHAQATRKLTPTFTQIYSYAIPECQVVLYQHTTALLSVFAVLQPWAGSEGRVLLLKLECSRHRQCRPEGGQDW